MAHASQAEIRRFFRRRGAKSGVIDRLKIRYRPYICPFDQLLAYAANHNAVFDIGCGSGQLCLLIGEFSEARRIHGIEIDDRLIRNARAEANDGDTSSARVTFALFDGTSIPEMIKEFDLVYMVDVLHHIPADAQEPFLRHLHERMAAGSTLVLKDIDASSPLVLANRIHDKVLSGAVGREWPFGRTRDFCASLGFSIVEARLQRIGVYPHYFLQLEK